MAGLRPLPFQVRSTFSHCDACLGCCCCNTVYKLGQMKRSPFFAVLGVTSSINTMTKLFALFAVLAVYVFSPVAAGGKLGYGGAGYGGLGYGGLGYGGLGYGGLGYGGLGYGGLGYGGLGGGLGGVGGVGGVGVGSSVALLSGGPAFAKAVAGPAFIVRTVHHVNKVSGGGALVAHSGLGSGYGGGYGGYGGGYGGYGGGYGGYGGGYGGYGGGYGGYGGGYGGYGGGYGGYGGGYGGYKSGYKG
ncbi:chorion class B protein B.L1-like isoform X2 [Dermacentor albipictus]|uniref:chorion class B protein B.L1-like isoform X2 n=1 Tax=Dermacentor albipictus TaxID=60249 RepID=UPI0038FD29AA